MVFAETFFGDHRLKERPKIIGVNLNYCAAILDIAVYDLQRSKDGVDLHFPSHWFESKQGFFHFNTATQRFPILDNTRAVTEDPNDCRNVAY